MTDCFERIIASCWKQFSPKKKKGEYDIIKHIDPLQWSRDLEKYTNGEFSFAVEQANDVLHDFSQVESFSNATFFSVYDGHIGPEAARFVCDNLFTNLLKRMAAENGRIYESTIMNAFAETEESFLKHVRKACVDEPLISAVGSCCLVGVIQNGRLYIANLGDSRAVLGYVTSRSPNKILAKQLTKDHNADSEEVRKELWKLHPKDPNIVFKRYGAWRVKGIIQVTRAIGDAYLKRPEFALDESFPLFHLTEELTEPALTAEPDIFKMDLDQNHKFVIFASDGLWEWLSIQKAVKIVQENPREGIARRLINVALGKVMKHYKMSFDTVKAYKAGSRRVLHDDITVIVVFLDSFVPNNSVTKLSVRGFSDGVVGPKMD